MEINLRKLPLCFAWMVALAPISVHALVDAPAWLSHVHAATTGLLAAYYTKLVSFD